MTTVMVNGPSSSCVTEPIGLMTQGLINHNTRITTQHVLVGDDVM